MTTEFTVKRCPPEERQKSLNLMHGQLNADDQVALLAALESSRDQGEAALDGLLVVEVGERTQDVAWVQLLPGNVAHVWPPSTHGPAAIALMHGIADFLDERKVQFSQILVGSDQKGRGDLYAEAKFEWLADLAYLTLEKAHFSQGGAPQALQFVPGASEEAQRLEQAILQTYESSLDCPRLNGQRQASDIISGYRAQGRFNPKNWYFVRHAGQDVGVLILAEHQGGNVLELVYMGVVPPFRGMGVGGEIVRFAVNQAQSLMVERLVLAVDRGNEYALNLYRQAGFSEWAYRKVFARWAG